MRLYACMCRCAAVVQMRLTVAVKKPHSSRNGNSQDGRRPARHIYISKNHGHENPWFIFPCSPVRLHPQGQRIAHLPLPPSPLFTAFGLQIAQTSMPRSSKQKPQTTQAPPRANTRSQKENIAPPIVEDIVTTATAGNDPDHVDLIMDNEPTSAKVRAWTLSDIRLDTCELHRPLRQFLR
jgi:hypothetical protein